uniref:Rab-GAP TBC domain-containing protein n=1 Tax=Percolomonas cosmopolitus TaxID=63605 RepID=A0A7S1KTF5_9EUKA|mmetsp:Transcript_7667/g.28730  ORF Transcript_7667/g.28730 Transcript_7667/m.28730 type:complete len:1066 (+) Transcript_7667:34-3231(+)
MSQSLTLSVQRFHYHHSIPLSDIQHQFQCIRRHRNLTRYIHVLGCCETPHHSPSCSSTARRSSSSRTKNCSTQGHNTAYAVSLQYIHTLHHELLFCLKHQQNPTKQRTHLMFHSICDAVAHLNATEHMVHGALTPHVVCMNSRNVLVGAYMGGLMMPPHDSSNHHDNVTNTAPTTTTTTPTTSVSHQSEHKTGLPLSTLNRRHLDVPHQNGLFMRHHFHSLYHKSSAYNFNVIYLPPDYFVAHLNGIDLDMRYDIDTWAVAVIIMFYVVGRLFLEVFVLDGLEQKSTTTAADASNESVSPQDASQSLLPPKHVNPLLFYSNMQQFRSYFTETASTVHNLSHTKRERFEACYTRLKSTLSDSQMNFIMEGIRATNRPAVTEIYQSTADTSPSTTSLGSSSTQSFPLSSRHSNYVPPQVRSTQLNPGTKDVSQPSSSSNSEPNTSDDIEHVDEKVQNNLTDMYFSWISQFSAESVIQFLESRLSLSTTLPLYNYPAIRYSNILPPPHHPQVNDPSLLDGAIGNVFMNPLQQNDEYRIPASFFSQWHAKLTTQNSETKTRNSGTPSSAKKRPNSTVIFDGGKSESEQYQERVRQFSCLADVNGDLIKYKTKNSYSFSQMLTDQEKNLRHQHQRVELFRSLIADYPSTRNRIISEARKDIPPVLRGEIWACVLGAEQNYEDLYEGIIRGGDSPGSKKRPGAASFTTDCDRQISVDVPRCHQYHSKLNCEQGRQKLEILLKAWTKYHDGALVYWQGLDSLCAPFVVLNYHNEALAFSCLLKLVDKYVQQFFQENNSNAMEYQLCMFEKLLSYHEPQISHHMDIIGFKPELYTIPWFLTLFAHVLPIEKIFRLWDHILLDTHLLPLHIAVSFLKQQRTELLHSDFNEMMGVLTNMHHINIEKVVEDSYALQQKTPKCILDPKCLQYLPIREYKELKYPRITADDLCSTDMYQISLIIDIQHPHNYAKRHCTKAYHISPVRQKKSKVPADDWLKDFEIDESDLSLLKSNVLHHLQYKRGIPIVLISDHSRIEQEVERHLLRHNYPYVSIVLGGMVYFSHMHQQFVVSGQGSK